MSAKDFTWCRLYLSNITALINRKDIRSVRKWCIENNLTIHRDGSGEFVYKTEFELAYDMPLINSLRIKHPEDWKKYYALYKSGKAYETISFNERVPHKKVYKPKGKIAAKIFDRS